MNDKAHLRSTDPRSAARLVTETTLGVVGIVEELHQTIGRLARVIGTPSEGRTGGVTGLVYRSIRGAVRATGGGVDMLLRPLEALLREREQGGLSSSAERLAFVAALNGVIGDRLAETDDPLAIPMALQHAGRPLSIEREQIASAIPAAERRLLLLVHGLCMHPGQWGRGGPDPGIGLAEMHGSTLLHLHYNTGRRIGTNGRELARLLESLVDAWPVELEGIAIVGHSMGGLVARSACHDATARGHRWPSLLRRMVFLGTPHHGSPLERGGHIVDAVLGASPYTAAFSRIGGLRSAGITDLRHGTLLEDDALGAHRVHVPLPDGVACHAVAGALAREDQRAKRLLLGDGLVTVESALGRQERSGTSLAFDEDKQWIAHGVGHLALMNDPAVLERVGRWLARRQLPSAMAAGKASARKS